MRNASQTATRTLTRAIVIACLLLLGSVLVFRPATYGMARDDDSTGLDGPTASSMNVEQNLLRNGGLNGNYYWVSPNHYVAPEWRRWWIDGSVLPEYDRSRGSEPFIEGDRSQRWHKWASRYVAGIYQVADQLTPCTLYQLGAWVRTDSIEGTLPHTRVGLDPTGVELTRAPTSGAIQGFAAATVWSPEQIQLFTWEQLAVTAEATRDTITAILYSAPEPRSTQTPFYAHYWDDARLIAVPFPGNRLPDPDSPIPSGFITNLRTNFQDGRLTVEWDTLGPASTQLLYSVEYAVITSTDTLSNVVYLPVISAQETLPLLDTTPRLSHQVTLTGLKLGDTVEFVALSRRPDGVVCRTETSAQVRVTIGSTLMQALGVSQDPGLDPDR
jgi:hypothetical protein